MSTSKTPYGVLAAVKAKCAEIVALFIGITHVYGYNDKPDHNNRRCIDFMVGDNRAAGDAVADYLTTNWKRLGVRVVIWQGRIWRSYDKLTGSRSPGRAFQWAPYNEANKHRDHPHAEFNDAAYIAPGNPVARPNVWLDRLVPGVTNSDSVRAVERALGLDPTGNYDDRVVAAVKKRQQAWGDDPKYCDGILGPKQAVRLFATAAMPVTIRTDPSGEPPPKPKPEEPAMPTAHLTVTGLNVLRRTDPEAGKKRLPWGKRLPGIIAVLKSTNPDLILLQELDQQTAADIATGLGNGWAYHRKNGIGIMWRQTVLERTGEPVAKLYSDRDNRYVTGIPLRHKPTGQTFTAWVTHLENDGDPATDGHNARRLQTREFVNYTGTGDAIMGADLNSTTPVLANPTVRQKEKPRSILAAGGWRLLSQIRHSNTVVNGMRESHWGGRATDNITNGPWIDDIGVRGRITILGGGLILTSHTRCSDHHALLMVVQLKQQGRAVSES